MKYRISSYLFPPLNSFRTFMYCDLWPYVLWPLDFQIQKRIISVENIWGNMVCVYTHQLIVVIHIIYVKVLDQFVVCGIGNLWRWDFLMVLNCTLNLVWQPSSLFRINLVSFRTFRGYLFHKQETGQTMVHILTGPTYVWDKLSDFIPLCLQD